MTDPIAFYPEVFGCFAMIRNWNWKPIHQVLVVPKTSQYQLAQWLGLLMNRGIAVVTERV
jgi:hypothetical protein